MRSLVFFTVFLSFIFHNAQSNTERIQSYLAEHSLQKGFLSVLANPSKGEVWALIDIQQLEQAFLYQPTLATGIGSNDIGLDRGQLGSTQLVEFRDRGHTIHFVALNSHFRADSHAPTERHAVKQAFSESILAALPIIARDESSILINLNPLLLSDQHPVLPVLNARDDQISFTLDKSRSAVDFKLLKTFPNNTELQSVLSFQASRAHPDLYQVTPNASTVSIYQRHSFIRLPDEHYQPRLAGSRSGFFTLNYQDYASQITEPLTKRLLIRHRLVSKNTANEVVEPIIYYVESSVPEPIRSALIEGASWWSTAFESAGFSNAFEVRLLPETADPLDIRYNVIQWVHRSTRGWSYGASVVDPRTGEIIKGHVSLGSLRVRQDIHLLRALTASDGNTIQENEIGETALLRIKQLSAHEVGHTLGLAHNFAASTQDRSSVMDYPYPKILLKQKQWDFSQAYTRKIGPWDQLAIQAAYGSETLRQQALESMNAWRYLSDADANFGAHPWANRWDNGKDAITELERLAKQRLFSLNQFDQHQTLPGFTDLHLERSLVLSYLSHRYQIKAVASLLGGHYYAHNMKHSQATDGQVSASRQSKAIQALLDRLADSELEIPRNILNKLQPPLPGFQRDREFFETRSEPIFDPFQPSRDLSKLIFDEVFKPSRINRIQQHDGSDWGLMQLLQVIEKRLFSQPGHSVSDHQKIVQHQFILQLIHLSNSAKLNELGLAEIKTFELRLINSLRKLSKKRQNHNWYLFLVNTLESNTKEAKASRNHTIPPGSPIGSQAKL